MFAVRLPSMARFSPIAVMLLAGTLGACNLIGASGLQTDYSFDALHYASPAFGDPSATGATVPDVPCTPGDDTVCAAIGQGLGVDKLSLSCDASINKCVARAEVRVSETVDISKQMESSFPPQAIQFGVQVVEVKRVTYWIEMNALNVATPAIEIFVAPAAARDEKDPKAALLTSIHSLAAKSNVCGDAAYDKGDPKAAGAPVCAAPLPEPGKAALADFVKDYKTPFQVIAHAVIVAHPGDPLPSGSIAFSARPTVGLKILD